ncbi:MAG: MFS transporter [Myxococcota bacterium]
MKSKDKNPADASALPDPARISAGGGGDAEPRLERDSDGKWRALALLALAEVLALALWYSATAVIPALRAEFSLSDRHASLFSSIVSIGFVFGTLLSAGLQLADRLPARSLFSYGALFASLMNLVIVLDPTGGSALVARFATGLAMAFVYPIGMKMAASWARGDTGLLVGLLVGALTLGSASPHLFNAWGGLDWRSTVITSSGCAAVAALLVRAVKLGPAHSAPRRFDPKIALRALRDPSLRLANLGYFGHMWELYAMWAWIGIYLLASFETAQLEGASRWAALGTFFTIAVGAVGSLFAGLVADRLGRTLVTTVALTVSGSCCLLSGLVFGASPGWVIAVALVWGVSVVADSAQFSSSVIELSPPEQIGTMLTVQTCIGFLIPLFSIHWVPVWVEAWGWRFGFAPLVLGPVVGVVAMLALRRRPEALRLASGRR